MVKKRKTHTSTEVKERYNSKVYTQIATRVPKELAKIFKEKCEERNISQRQVIIGAMEEFVKKD